MNIGDRINHLRKENHLSQDDFANLLHVTRQTISNWENEKSYPDLETLMKISEHFKISVDELLRGDATVVKRIDSEKDKKNKLKILIVDITIIAVAIIVGMYLNFQEDNAVNFSMGKSQTYQGNNTSEDSLDVGTGYFVIPKSGKLNITAKASTDDGKLHIVIIDDNNKTYYQIDGKSISDIQKLYFKKGSYIIQIVADNYKEDVVSLDYYIKVNN
ncbi:MAG: helix-turn-helix transcriptional regulator [Anaerovoracaceae bacterium]